MRTTLVGEEATESFGRALAPLLRGGEVVLLEGPLGAGKTTLVRGMLRGLGWPDDEPVTSPTFALVAQYPTAPPTLHADLYRLATPRDVDELGIDEAVRAGSVALVEWGGDFVAALPPVDLVVSLSCPDEHHRDVRVDARSARGGELLSLLGG